LFLERHGKMKIEFGGGNNPKRPNFRQVDIRKINDDTIVCNAWEIDQQVDVNCVTEIFSRHFFEHLSHDQAKRTLDSWHKILVKGGRVEMLVPNMSMHIWQWLNWDNLTDKEKNHCRTSIWGQQREADESSWDLHKAGYDYPKLKELVEEHGFTTVRLLARNDHEFKHLHVDFFKP